jgi:hypothetical protein
LYFVGVEASTRLVDGSLRAVFYTALPALHVQGSVLGTSTQGAHLSVNPMKTWSSSAGVRAPEDLQLGIPLADLGMADVIALGQLAVGILITLHARD